MSAEAAYHELLRLTHERALLSSCGTLLEWDEETYMPAGGAPHRADQHALLARLEHELCTDPRVGDLLAAVEASELVRDLDGAVAANVRLLRKERDSALRVPASLVEALARATTLAADAWHTARKERRAEAFLPHLERVVALVRAEAECLAGTGDPYDALLDEWEPGLRGADLDALLQTLRARVAPLLARIAAAPPRADRSLLRRAVPVERQRAFVAELAVRLGFELEHGRIDEAVHPSTVRVGPGDTRLTTRFEEHAPLDGIFATLHEVGHGLYEQGLPPEHFGAPVGEAPSLGLHESQARLVENALGRSHAFWRFAYPSFQAAAAPAFDDVGLDDFHRAVASVAPGPSRIRADEVTYDLHIILRVELERALVSGTLPVRDLPGAWDEAYARTLGVRPRDDAEGCLQDGHWADGMFGYFPTYTIGNLIAAQLMERARDRLPDLDEGIARGDFAPLAAYLRDEIHRHGARFGPLELVARATGRPLAVDALAGHLERRYGAAP